MVIKTNYNDEEIVSKACHEFMGSIHACEKINIIKGLASLVGSLIETIAKPDKKQDLLNSIVKLISVGIEMHDKQEKEGGL